MKTYILIYFIANLFFLTLFPFVHSDEPWLSGLSRHMLAAGSLSVTEPFFDLYPRNPHAIKSLFHLMQAGFISLWGYSIFTVRLISLIFGCLSLWLFHKVLKQLRVTALFSYLATVILSVDIQFIYASHFARQEIIVLFLMLGTFLMLLKFSETKNFKFVVFAAVLTGLAIGVHPNSFIIGMTAIVLLGYNIFTGRSKPAALFIYTGVLSIFAAVFVSLSLSFDPDFFANYARYGSQFDVFAPLDSKFGEMKDYFLKLYYGVSGTYYTPDIRLEFFLFGAFFLCSLFAGGGNKPGIQNVWCALAGVFLGMGIIGRYNQTYVFFFFPFAYMLLPLILGNARAKWKAALLGLILAAALTSSYLNIAPWLQHSYTAYLDEINAVIPHGQKTIGNLNAGYAFGNGELLDYRNLTFIKEKGLTFEEYVKTRNVKYIIVSDELEFIYELRPKWDGIYGDINFLDELSHYLNQNCELVHTFRDNTYGVRIVRFINSGADFHIRIYKVR